MHCAGGRLGLPLNHDEEESRANACHRAREDPQRRRRRSSRTGKTALVEALLFQAGETNRLGTIDAGTTVSDWDDDEQRRMMSISLSLRHAEWQDRKLNLIDMPGDPSFQGEADRCAPRRRGRARRRERRDGRRGRHDAGLAASRGARDRARRSSSTCSTASGPTSSAPSASSRNSSPSAASPSTCRSAPSTS